MNVIFETRFQMDQSDLADIINAGVKLAVEASQGKAYIAGSIGPFPFVEGEPISLTEQASLLEFQISILANSKVDLLIEEVSIIYRRTKEEMPAAPEEIHEAEFEGINIMYLALPVEAVGENGKLKSLKCQKLQLSEFDASGRRKPRPIEGDVVNLEIDMLISAISQEPDTSFLKAAGLDTDKGGKIKIDTSTMKTNLLIEKRREEAIEQTENEYIELANQERLVLTVEVTTVVHLTLDEEARLVEKLANIYGKKIQLKKHVSSKIIGGAKLKVGDKVIDGSIKTALSSLKEKLLNG